ncbi:uncharacterized protein PAE49_006114 isoform 2-T2 [Odontesthes bonariensis]
MFNNKQGRMECYTLKAGEDKFVGVRGTLSKPKLCLVELQNCDTDVFIETRQREGKEQMAFKFKDSRGSFVVKVAENSLKLEKVDGENMEDRPDNHWFQKENVDGSNYYHLKTVSVALYLTIKGSSFQLTRNEQDCAVITHVSKV